MEEWVAGRDLRVPSIPTAVADAMRLANDPNATVHQIGDLVSKDQAISGKIIQIVNSPLMRGIKEITTIDSAITRLGQNELRMILLGMFTETRLFRSKQYGLLMKKLWEHSLACATLSRFLAKMVGYNEEVAYLAGFLHDVGLPALLLTITDHYPGNESLDPLIIELAMKSVHQKAGDVVVKTWNMPSAVVEAVSCHHRFLKAENHMQLAAIVQLADVFCYRYGIGFSASERQQFKSASMAYLPLKYSYLKANEINLENYPPFEILGVPADDILQKINASSMELRQELETPFLSTSSVKKSKKSSPVELAKKVAQTQIEAGKDSGVSAVMNAKSNGKRSDDMAGSSADSEASTVVQKATKTTIFVALIVIIAAIGWTLLDNLR